MPDWPSNLQPYPSVEGYSEAPPNVAIRTEMDAGPAKMRRRYTANARKVTANVVLRTKSEVTDLERFYNETLQGGVLSFQWQDRNAITRTFRFTGGDDALVFEAIEPDRWKATMQLEILP